jgi:hypothetical protein
VVHKPGYSGVKPIGLGEKKDFKPRGGILNHNKFLQFVKKIGSYNLSILMFPEPFTGISRPIRIII